MKEDQNTWEHYLTVGRLRERLAGLPEDTPVYYERIEDVYFEKHGWKPVVMPDPAHGWDGEHIRAWDAYLQDGRLVVTAHY